MCDTSYSDMGAKKDKNPADNRGIAYSVVDIDHEFVTVHGILANGARHNYMLNT